MKASLFKDNDVHRLMGIKVVDSLVGGEYKSFYGFISPLSKNEYVLYSSENCKDCIETAMDDGKEVLSVTYTEYMDMVYNTYKFHWDKKGKRQ